MRASAARALAALGCPPGCTACLICSWPPLRSQGTPARHTQSLSHTCAATPIVSMIADIMACLICFSKHLLLETSSIPRGTPAGHPRLLSRMPDEWLVCLKLQPTPTLTAHLQDMHICTARQRRSLPVPTAKADALFTVFPFAVQGIRMYHSFCWQ
jgi:hypothetical protein